MGFLICWHTIVHIFSCDTFYFCKGCIDVSTFISDFHHLNLLTFVLGESSKWFVNFINLYKEPILGFLFLYSFYHFSVLYSVISALSLFPSF